MISRADRRSTTWSSFRRAENDGANIGFRVRLLYNPCMNVTVNGELKVVPDDATVRWVIEDIGLGKAACAAEVNKRLVPRREHEKTTLREGDRVELVSLVGGG